MREPDSDIYCQTDCISLKYEGSEVIRKQLYAAEHGGRGLPPWHANFAAYAKEEEQNNELSGRTHT